MPDRQRMNDDIKEQIKIALIENPKLDADGVYRKIEQSGQFQPMPSFTSVGTVYREFHDDLALLKRKGLLRR